MSIWQVGLCDGSSFLDQVAANDPYVRKVQLWFDSSPDNRLSSQQLLELMPSYRLLDSQKGWGYNRFSLERPFSLFQSSKSSGLSDRKQRAKELTDEFVEAKQGTPENAFKIGELLYYGLLGYQNLTESVHFYQQAANAGHADAQFMVGLAYSTGLFGNWEKDTAKACLYYTFSALNGSPRGSIAIGYRYMVGLDVPENPETAYDYLSVAADMTMDYLEDFPSGLGVREGPYNNYVIADESDKGMMGPMRYPEYMLTRSPLRLLLSEFDSIEEGIQYLEFSAYEDGMARFLKNLAQVYKWGPDNGQPDYEKAIKFAHELLDRLGTTNLRKSDRVLAGWAHGFLGDCYRRGQGVEFNLEKAIEEYKIGLEIAPDVPQSKKQAVVFKGATVNTCIACNTGLGIISWQLMLNETDEAVVKKLYEEGRNYFEEGTKIPDKYKDLEFYLHNDVASYYFARHLFDNNHPVESEYLMKRASRTCHNASYFLGDLYATKASEISSPQLKTSLFSKASQRMFSVCTKAEDFIAPLQWSQAVYRSNLDGALAGFLISAELGLTTAQVNVADALDVHHSVLPIRWLRAWPVPSYVKPGAREELALHYFTLAGMSDRPDALYKAADYHFDGVGCEKNNQAAVLLYRFMVRFFRYNPAYWALGWMAQNGFGVKKSYYVARQFYDGALWDNPEGKNPEAYLAVKLSLFKLRILNFIAKITGEKIQLISEVANQAPKRPWREVLSHYRQKLEQLQAQNEMLLENENHDVETIEINLNFSLVFAIFTALVTFIYFRRRFMAANRRRNQNGAPPAAAAAIPRQNI